MLRQRLKLPLRRPPTIRDKITAGGYRWVHDAPAGDARRAATRLVLCSGKVYYDLSLSPRRAQAAHVAIGRVELLYPFPSAEIAELMQRYPKLRTIVSVQEDPRTRGPRMFMLRRLSAF